MSGIGCMGGCGMGTMTGGCLGGLGNIGMGGMCNQPMGQQPMGYGMGCMGCMGGAGCMQGSGCVAGPAGRGMAAGNPSMPNMHRAECVIPCLQNLIVLSLQALSLLITHDNSMHGTSRDWSRFAYPVQRSYGISVDEWSDQPLAHLTT